MTVDIEIPKLRLLIENDPRPAYVIGGSAGVAPRTLSEYMCGKREFRPGDLTKLCKELECDPEDITGTWLFRI